MAQQFACQHPRRCRRLILVSTGDGAGQAGGAGKDVDPELITNAALFAPIIESFRSQHLMARHTNRRTSDTRPCGDLVRQVDEIIHRVLNGTGTPEAARLRGSCCARRKMPSQIIAIFHNASACQNPSSASVTSRPVVKQYRSINSARRG